MPFQIVSLVYLVVRILACVALAVLAFFGLGAASDWLGRQTGRPLSHRFCMILSVALAFWSVFLR